MKPVLVFDTECYTNYFLLAFRNVATGNVTSFERTASQTLDVKRIVEIFRKHRVVSFNGINYDIPIISLALTNATNETLKLCSDRIIQNGSRPWDLEREFRFQCLRDLDHIDLIEVAPGKASLKLYGGRIHAQKLQDLPIEPHEVLTDAQMQDLKLYCTNDLSITQVLYEKLKPQLELREQMSSEYNINLMSKSDAQIAEAVIKQQVEKRKEHPIAKPQGKTDGKFRYKKPAFIEMISNGGKEAEQLFCQAEYYVSAGGKIVMPEHFKDKKVVIDGREYKLGIGGLHSCEESQAVVAEGFEICDFDVASYYPAIVINCGIYPESMGQDFSVVYRGFRDKRLEAKRSGNKVASETYKIFLNGSFGKLGNPYSVLFSPSLLIQVTVTGQLALLMLIERVSLAGGVVVSANTDGIVVCYEPMNKQAVHEAIAQWEKATGFETENTPYRLICSQNVNNYIAIKPDGTAKTKGRFVPAGLQKNPTTEICTEAVINYLKTGQDIAETITSCRDVTKFLSVRTVKGGAVKDGEYLGKVVRWYYSTSTGTAIHYKINGYLVPRTEGAMPMMELPPEFPDDVDYLWYIEEAYSMLQEIGYA